LLKCNTCGTLEELPDFDGPPERDVLLDALSSRHRTGDMEHLGNLIKISQSDWDNAERRKEILKQVTSNDTTGFDPEFYATKDTFQQDAMKCFNEHNRPERCIDWQDDRKRLGNPTSAGWNNAPKIYLCAYCPVASRVMVEKRAKRGDYK